MKLKDLIELFLNLMNINSDYEIIEKERYKKRVTYLINTNNNKNIFYLNLSNIKTETLTDILNIELNCNDGYCLYVYMHDKKIKLERLTDFIEYKSVFGNLNIRYLDKTIDIIITTNYFEIFFKDFDRMNDCSNSIYFFFGDKNKIIKRIETIKNYYGFDFEISNNILKEYAEMVL